MPFMANGERYGLRVKRQCMIFAEIRGELIYTMMFGNERPESNLIERNLRVIDESSHNLPPMTTIKPVVNHFAEEHR